MYKIYLLIFSLLLGSSLFAMSKKGVQAQVDDWDYNATVEHFSSKKTRLSPTAMSSSMMTKSLSPMAKGANLGFSVGGAKDADNFYANIKEGYLPKLSSLTYEGLFYDYYFDSVQTKSCDALFCPNYSAAISKNPFTQEEEYFLSVGLDSNIKEADFARKKLNIVVILDISGSMGASFDRYYYDKNHKVNLDKEERKKSKMLLANEAIVGMIEHLAPQDSLGVVLFDNDAYIAKPLRLIKNTKIEATKKHILDLKERGGTNWSAGYRKGIALFDTIEGSFKDPKVYENRIIFLTDAMPNRGELDKEGLFSIAKEASEHHIYTTFIGIGVDFNNDLVEAVSKTKGANYYAIHSSKEFQKRLDVEFDYMVTPLVFDLQLSLLGDAFEIDTVYGSPEADKASGTIMFVNTLFPSPTSKDGTRGGVILLKLKKKNAGKEMHLKVRYHDREGKAYETEKVTRFKSGVYHDNTSIQKAILLTREVDLLQNFLLDSRQTCHDKVSQPFEILKRTCGLYPPRRSLYPNIKTWERKSCPLVVSAGYQKIFSFFQSYFKTQMKEMGDNTLAKEITLMEQLLTPKTVPTLPVDDWKGENR